MIIMIIIISISSSSSINLSAQQLLYPRAGLHVGPPRPPPLRVGWCRRPSEPRQREAAQRESEAEQDFDQSYPAGLALYWAEEELRSAATRQAPWRGSGMGLDPGEHRWKQRNNQ